MAEEAAKEGAEGEAKPQEAPKEEKKEEPKESQTKAENPKRASINYVYGALLLHSAGKEINEANLKKVIDSTGTSSDQAQIKALVSSLEGVDIDDAIKQSFISPAPAQPAGQVEAPKEEKKEEKPEKKAEEAAEGLSSLFG